ncbi:transcriptional repressor [Puniceicoccaceae bacterium]|nr:transcriptional repressor [Puniceicoccaceae bacterium]
MIQTRQREVILDVLREAGRPLTREEVLRFGRQKIERLGSATVDRAIREMTAEFYIIGVEFPGQPRRYELPAQQEHPHFVCRMCDRVFDLPIAMQLPKISPPKGFLVTGGEVIYSGTCPTCRASMHPQ